MRNGFGGALALALIGVARPAAAQEDPAMARAMAIERSLHPRNGDVAIPQAGATLHLGKAFYYLDPAEARKVLVDLWGNPPDAAEGVLGLVLPAGKTVTDNVWGGVVTYNGSGYVTDDDAKTADYDKVLADLREGEEDNNKERVKAGYPAMHLVGWAQPPSYDKATHSVIWARDIRATGEPVDLLNYDVRLLGRRGVLSLNMVSDMPHLDEVRAAAATFGRTAQYTTGATYAEFDEAKGDKRAGYGLAGLVAAGVGLAAAKKLGLLAIALGFGKKFIILFAVAAAGLRKFFGKLVGRKDKGDGGEAAV